MSKLTQERVKEVLNYDEDTGIFTWRKRIGVHCVIGREAGYKSDGYIRIQIDKTGYCAHRVAWLYAYGKLPDGQIDHINHIRDDNRLSNLRDVSQQENLKNIRKVDRNTSGYTGVTWNKRDKRWNAFIRADGKRIHLGNFKGKMEAVKARELGETKYNYHPNHGKRI